MIIQHVNPGGLPRWPLTEVSPSVPASYFTCYGILNRNSDHVPNVVANVEEGAGVSKIVESGEESVTIDMASAQTRKHALKAEYCSAL